MKPIIVDGGKGTVELGADEIIYLVWNPGIVLDVDDAHAAVTHQARSVFAEPCAASRIALLDSSPIDRVIANFTMGLHTLPCPTRFFTSRAEATAWLLNTPLP